MINKDCGCTMCICCKCKTAEEFRCNAPYCQCCDGLPEHAIQTMDTCVKGAKDIAVVAGD